MFGARTLAELIVSSEKPIELGYSLFLAKVPIFVAVSLSFSPKCRDYCMSEAYVEW